MRLHDSVVDISTNITNTNSFTIKTSPKAFKILSDNLYSDKITAIIREYSTNAYDSHVSAGKATTPFIVHLPSYEEPFFSVQDFGTGMDHSTIYTLFTTYFDSNKTESNDFIGALGLGSKSAFSYTDSFVVESVYNSTYCVYTCFLGEDGTPKIAKIVDQDTDKENGITIKINVKRGDISEFINKAKKIYYFFDTPPTIVNCNSDFPRPEVLLSGSNWKLVKPHTMTKAIALQGNVYYPISDTKFSDVKHQFVLANNFIIQFPIGQLETAASRETLSYDELTVKNISSRLNQVFDEFYDLFIQEVRQAETLWKANLQLKQSIRKYGLKSSSDLPVLYNGEALTGSFNFHPEKFKTLAFIYQRDHSTVKKTHFKYEFSIYPDKDVIVFGDGLKPRESITKARSLVKFDNRIIFFDNFDQAIVDCLGKADHILTSQMEKPKSTPSSRKKTKDFILYTGSFYSSNGYSFKDLTGTIYYVPLLRGKIVNNGQKINTASFQRMLDNAYTLNILSKDVKIYGIIKSVAQKYSHRLINVLDFLPQELNRVLEKQTDKVKEFRKISIALEKWFSSHSNKFLYNAFKEGRMTLPLYSKMYFIFYQVSQLQKQKEEFFKGENFNLINSLLPKIEIEDDSKIDNLLDYYPMLEYLNHYISSTIWNFKLTDKDIQNITAYVQELNK